VDKLDLGAFVATGHLAEGNELLVNFAALQDGVVIYPDMIQVSVSLDTRNVAGYDASKYLLSHTNRELPAPALTEDEARAKVNPRLNIERVRLALIPLGNLEERLTYEVKGKIDSDTYYVYINALTGSQEKILLIVETPEGSRSI
jgi:germination protein YpeB